MDVALSAAQWVVGKALAPIADGLLEAWAASKNLGANIEDLRMELLLVKATLENANNKQLDGRPALEELLQKMRDSAHKAEDVLDELDYFRIHDELNGTFDAADENPKGIGHELVQTARHTAKAFVKPLSPAATSAGKVLCCPMWRARRKAPGSSSSAPSTNQAGEEVRGRTSNLGNLNPSSSLLPNVHDAHDNPAMSIPSNNDTEKHSLEFSRAEVSDTMKQIVDQLRPLRADVSTILLGCARSLALDIAHNRPITTSESIEPKLYGRDITVNSIIKEITKGKYGTKDLTVLPIVGAGGIGKTTITQHIYHNKEVQNHFDVVIWVCVSLNFDPVKLLEEIKQKIPKVDGEKEGSTTNEVIAERLKSKRFLLVMDDMWKCNNEDDWKRLLLPLKKSQKNGNIIMVTTRLPELAQLVKTTDHSIELGGLEPEEFRKLFLAFVFGDEQYRMEHLLLLEIGEKIMEKLKGSPLAANTVGRLLRKDLDSHHWMRVLESKQWETQTADNDIMPALKLSYDYLPFHLQQCFSCCALYPEDYIFTSKELIHFWVGMDILHSGSRNKTVEDIGQTNLNDLVTHGFFRKDETDGRQRYIMHDLLHDLALNVASHDFHSLRRSNVMPEQFMPFARHLSIIIDSAGDSDGVTRENFKSELIKLKTRLKVEKLQTLLIFGEIDESFGHIFSDLFEKANGLRALHLDQISNPVESIFHNFSRFLHLRYLLLGTVYGSGMHLPGEISTFYHLRILDIEGWGGYLHLPKHFSNLAKLRHINTPANKKFHSAISNVGKLQFLQELNKFIVGREENGFELNQLSHLVDLTELGIYNLERVQTKETAAEARLADKIHMRNLKLQWESNNEPDMETLVLESLRPHKNLEHLYIEGYRGPSCPTWLDSKLCVKGLKSLQLDDVAWKTLPSLWKMWVLDELSLKRIHTLNEFGPNNFGPITEPSFCSLKRLTLFRLERLEKWVVGDAPQLFSGLQVLTIEECPELLELPFVNNMHFLPNLGEFIIKKCPKLMSLPPILWTHTLSLVEMKDVGPLSWLNYSKYSSPVKLDIFVEFGEQQEILLVPSNLTELQQLSISRGSALMLSDLKMLTSLKRLSLYGCKIVARTLGDSEWQLPIEILSISFSDVSGKEVAQLLCGLTRLRELNIENCKNITQLGVVAEKQTSLPGDETEETQATDLHQQHVSEIGGDDGRILLLPSNLTSCLQTLYIRSSSQLTLVTPNGQNQKQKGGLQALRSLRKLSIFYCSLRSSSCCPFPSSLQELSLAYVYMETLECLSNLTCLTIFKVEEIELRSEVLWHLVSMGQLRELYVIGRQFMSFPVPVQDEQEQLLLSRSCKLYKLRTGDIEGFLCGSVCRVLSFSLTILDLYLYREIEGFTKEQEEALHLLTSLQELEFAHSSKLRSLPEGLNKLTSLKRLVISHCPSIRCLPKDGLPSSLQTLDVSWCENDELKEQCRQLTGTIPEIDT